MYIIYVYIYVYTVYRIFWPITRMVYNPHRHENVKFSKKIVVLPAPTDNPYQS